MLNLISDYMYISKHALNSYLLNEIKTIDLNKLVFIFIFHDYKENTNFFESINLDFNFIKEILRLIIKNISNLHVLINRVPLIQILNQLTKKNKNLNILLKENNKDKLKFISSIFHILFKTLKTYYINKSIEASNKQEQIYNTNQKDLCLVKNTHILCDNYVLKLWMMAINQLYYEL